ncbi:DUF1653 domain-containing protein [Candidatus Nomurabacteria bacterium]|nr:DUF1653 domain-containing protein [Candidatus Nomurabacteria bacterium]
MKNLEIGAIYKHYKGNRYEVVGVANHSETLEEMVIYKALYNIKGYGENSLWVRPKEMFLENVIVNGVEMERFEKVEQPARPHDSSGAGGEILIKPSK